MAKVSGRSEARGLPGDRRLNEKAYSTHVPRRTCVACRAERDKRDLNRLIRTSEGKVVFDRTGTQPGRGAYLCSSFDCWKTGVSKKHLDRALRADISSEDRLRLLECGQRLCVAETKKLDSPVMEAEGEREPLTLDMREKTK